MLQPREAPQLLQVVLDRDSAFRYWLGEDESITPPVPAPVRTEPSLAVPSFPSGAALSAGDEPRAVALPVPPSPPPAAPAAPPSPDEPAVPSDPTGSASDKPTKTASTVEAGEPAFPAVVAGPVKLSVATPLPATVAEVAALLGCKADDEAGWTLTRLRQISARLFEEERVRNEQARRIGELLTEISTPVPPGAAVPDVGTVPPAELAARAVVLQTDVTRLTRELERVQKRLAAACGERASAVRVRPAPQPATEIGAGTARLSARR
jgi:hypothetical protein